VFSYQSLLQLCLFFFISSLLFLSPCLVALDLKSVASFRCFPPGAGYVLPSAHAVFFLFVETFKFFFRSMRYSTQTDPPRFPKTLFGFRGAPGFLWLTALSSNFSFCSFPPSPLAALRSLFPGCGKVCQKVRSGKPPTFPF